MTDLIGAWIWSAELLSDCPYSVVDFDCRKTDPLGAWIWTAELLTAPAKWSVELVC